MIFRLNCVRPALFAAWMLLAATAFADVKVVSHMKANVGSKVTERETVAYYKGDLMRVETGGSVTIYDVASKNSIVMDTAKKTYYRVSPDQMRPPMQGIKIDASATVTPSEEVMKVLGYDCKKYVADLAMSMSMEQQGGFSAKTDMHMELWTTTLLKTPFSSKHMMNMVGQMFRGAVDAGGMDKLAEEMGKIQGFPLNTKIIMNITGMPGMTPPKIEIETEVKSVSEEALADSLFEVPADYKKVERGNPRPPKVG